MVLKETRQHLQSTQLQQRFRLTAAVAARAMVVEAARVYLGREQTQP
jgi:hypothetical protein